MDELDDDFLDEAFTEDETEEDSYDREMADDRHNPALTAEQRNPSMGRRC